MTLFWAVLVFKSSSPKGELGNVISLNNAVYRGRSKDGDKRKVGIKEMRRRRKENRNEIPAMLI